MKEHKDAYRYTNVSNNSSTEMLETFEEEVIKAVLILVSVSVSFSQTDGLRSAQEPLKIYKREEKEL
jgi:HKD family nuclease